MSSSVRSITFLSGCCGYKNILIGFAFSRRHKNHSYLSPRTWFAFVFTSAKLLCMIPSTCSVATYRTFFHRSRTRLQSRPSDTSTSSCSSKSSRMTLQLGSQNSRTLAVRRRKGIVSVTRRPEPQR